MMRAGSTSQRIITKLSTYASAISLKHVYVCVCLLGRELPVFQICILMMRAIRRA